MSGGDGLKRRGAVALAAGVVFAVGLTLSGMTQPTKVLAFLDVSGDWDPSLAIVMLGAIGVHAIAVRFAQTTSAPWVADHYEPPRARGIDRRLLLGAALFGVGWAMAGFCPGPAVVSVATMAPKTLAFAFAMVVGMALYSATFGRTGPAS